MTRYRYTTPGTRLTWSDVSEWVVAAFRIGSRKPSAARNRLAVLKRQDQMPAGDNWTALFGGSDAHSG
ncbi:hypothetical protein KUV64_15060 [Mameliella alba]|uniref:hypothetical protein n=1 Tax=Mameliella alba TaxID=561184 RepID=UPI001C945049|nr:hypothetical protein [Mameliella alba]MBY6120452.1 hypothetical protein [Mameliella alba]